MNPAMQEYQLRIQSVLDSALNNADVPERLLNAMRYSTLSGGKRIRAMLVYATGVALDVPLKRLDSIAAALECIHAYSLIHDDLPAMDDDDLRRGQATNHVKYDDATAILAGDALQALAFELIADPNSELSDQQARQMIHTLAVSSGAVGMVGGQMLDILASNYANEPAKQLNLAQLENVHRRKTGALISAAVMNGAMACDKVTQTQLHAFQKYADCIGLAFQVVDDVLDIESSTQELGKPSGSDIELGKATYPALIGLQESKKLALNLYHEAIDCINTISDNTQPMNKSTEDNPSSQQSDKFSLLISIADLIINRTN